MANIFVYAKNEMAMAALIQTVHDAGQSSTAVAITAQGAEAALSMGADSAIILEGASNHIEDYALSVARLMQERSVICLLVDAVEDAQDFAALVAGHLDAGMASDVSAMSWTGEAFETTRTMYGGAVEVTETVSLPQVITCFAKASEARQVDVSLENAEVIKVDAPESVHVISAEPNVSSSIDIADADRIVCVGLGFSSQEDLSLAESLANALDAQLACTRPIASDREWLPAETYIGISGEIVAPELYLGLGVSGQVQHTYGIRDSKVIAVVNSNRDATFFNEADYGLVADLYEAAPLLAQAIARARS